MLRAVWENRRGRFFLLCGLSFVLSQLQMLFFLFVVPLHILFKEEGRREFLLASSAVVTAIIVVAAVELSVIQDRELRTLFLVFEAAVPLMLLLGVFIMLDDELIRIAGIYRFLLAVAVMGIIGFLVFSRMFASQTLTEIIQEQWRHMGMLFTGGSQVEGGMDDALVQDFFQSPELMKEMEDLFFRTWLVGFSALSLVCWRLGERFTALMRRQRSMVLEDLRIPQNLLWPSLIIWAVMLLLILFPVPILRYPVWNAGLVFLFLYGLQGLGLLQHLSRRRRLPRGIRFFGIMVLLALFMRPGWNSVVIIGIPALGLSEYWVHIRK